MKEYVLKMEVGENGVLSIESRNDGFNTLELMGLFSLKLQDISDQMQGKVKPDIIGRTYVEQQAGEVKQDAL